jgi:hypothetical protein
LFLKRNAMLPPNGYSNTYRVLLNI